MSLGTRRRRSAVTAVAITAATITLAACGTDSSSEDASGPVAVVHTKDDGFAGTLVEDPPFQLADVALNDTAGKPYHLGRLPAGRVTAVFFGYTNCDDVCPTAMADLAAARRALPAATAAKVDVVFITVDPDRDTASVLRSWLDRFDKSFVGLRGPTALVHQAEDSLHAARSDIEPSDAGSPNGHSKAGGSEVSHSGSVYVFGPANKSVLYSGGNTVADYAKDFAHLLKSS